MKILNTLVPVKVLVVPLVSSTTAPAVLDVTSFLPTVKNLLLAVIVS